VPAGSRQMRKPKNGPIGATLSGESGDPIGAAFIHASSQLAVLHERGGVAWDIRPHAWAHHACTVAGRPLTRPEWNAVLPEHDYAPACTPLTRPRLDMPERRQSQQPDSPTSTPNAAAAGHRYRLPCI
jgi:hypothetical protein